MMTGADDAAKPRHDRVHVDLAQGAPASRLLLAFPVAPHMRAFSWRTLCSPAAKPKARPLQQKTHYDDGVQHESKPVLRHVGLRSAAQLQVLRLRRATRLRNL